MCLGCACADVFSALLTLWIMGLGMAIMFGMASQYVRGTQRWLAWSVALIVRTGKQWLGSLARVIVRWIGHQMRHW